MYQPDEHPPEYGVYLSANIARFRGVRPWSKGERGDRLEGLLRKIRALTKNLSDA